MDKTRRTTLVIGCGRMQETIERFMRDEDLVAVLVKDQRRDRNTVLKVERLLSPREATWLASPGDLWLRFEVKDFGTIEAYGQDRAAWQGRPVRPAYEEMLRRLR